MVGGAVNLAGNGIGGTVTSSKAVVGGIPECCGRCCGGLVA